MSSAGISFSGLGSGLDTQAIISALLAVERRPVTALNQKKSSFKTQKSLFGDLDQKLETLRDLANGLRKSIGFLGFSAEVDRDDYLTATANESAAKGTYDIEVLNLATTQVNHSDGEADKDTTTFGSGTLEFTIGGTSTFVEIDGTNNTLQGIVGAINAAGIDVQASVLDTGSGATPFKLIVNGSETGVANAVTIALDTGSQALQDLMDELNANQVSTAEDAQFTLNGITVNRSSNTVADAITGVTLNLKGEQLTDPITTKLTISPDPTSTGNKVDDFVNAYNEIVDFAESQGQVDDDGNANNPLFGDSMLRSIRSSLRIIVGSTFDTGNTSYSLFSQIGITSDREGRLTFNRGTFDTALETDEDAVRKLFVDSTNGIASRMYDQIDLYTDSVDGLIKTRQDGFDSQIKQTDQQIDRGELRLENLETSLRARFASLESLMAKLQSQAFALSAFSINT
jgi:flagellar hook-associated protein 2